MIPLLKYVGKLLTVEPSDLACMMQEIPPLVEALGPGVPSKTLLGRQQKTYQHASSSPVVQYVRYRTYIKKSYT